MRNNVPLIAMMFLTIALTFVRTEAQENTPTVCDMNSSKEFEGRVIKIEMITEFAGSIIPTDVDIRWVISIEADMNGEKREVFFGIHSPTKLFGMPSSQILSKKFKFKVSRVTSTPNDEPRFDLSVEAREVGTSTSKSTDQSDPKNVTPDENRGNDPRDK